MQVIYKNANNKNIAGELIVRFDGTTTFNPTDDKYGVDCMLINGSQTFIGADDDDGCIMVKGFMKLEDGNFKSDIWVFYPTKA